MRDEQCARCHGTEKAIGPEGQLPDLGIREQAQDDRGGITNGCTAVIGGRGTGLLTLGSHFGPSGEGGDVPASGHETPHHRKTHLTCPDETDTSIFAAHRLLLSVRGFQL